MKFFPLNGVVVRSRRFAWLAIMASLAALLGLACVQGPVEAFQANGSKNGLLDLNAALRKEAPKISAELEKRGYKNVGVLKFQVKVDKRSNTMHAGRLNQQMATRLENALILLNDPTEPSLGVTRNAGQAAMQKDNKATWLTKAGRENLFQYSYPLAWGKKTAKVDAFLTGIVGLDSNADVANVGIYVFDKQSPAPKMVTSFQARLTPQLLSETGQRFIVKQRTLTTGTGGTIIDQNPIIPDNPAAITPEDNSFDSVLDFKISYDDTLVAISPDGNGTFKCDPPGLEVKTIHFKLKATERIGLVLYVNGINTLQMARADSADVAQQYRWILEANKEYAIEGFYPSFKECLPFKVSPDKDADPGELGPEDKWGLIEMHVFRDPGVGGPSGGNADTPTVPDLQQSGPPELELRSLVKKLSKINKTPARNLILSDKLGSKEANVQEMTFNGTLAMSRTITYFKKGASVNLPNNP